MNLYELTDEQKKVIAELVKEQNLSELYMVIDQLLEEASLNASE